MLAYRCMKTVWEEALKSKCSDFEMQAEMEQDEEDVSIHHLFLKY